MILLVIYPAEFKSFSKFERKLKKIIGTHSPHIVLYSEDASGFVQQYFGRASGDLVLRESTFSDASDHISHAIVFGDGELFKDEIRVLTEKNINFRRVDVSITRVVNVRRDEKYKFLKSTSNYEYIGRGSYWGNPYSMQEPGNNREEAIRKFKYDFEFDKLANREKAEVYKLAGKRLGCFCSPAPCHGDVLAEFLNSWDDGL